ncbi:hypothetical protein BMS3Abin03_01576 [bacterium BMS3Abin03]|nr:hypothetical protein BMS3Abin03_01576 [bacterium BMS3Abin03]
MDAIKQLETAIKKIRKDIKEKQFELEIKLSLKRLGADEEKETITQMIKQADAQIEKSDPDNKEEKKKITALKKDKKILRERLAKIDNLMEAIGERITAEECKTLILKKLYDLVANELERYLNAEKRHLISVFENWWDKYAVSAEQLEKSRTETLEQLNGFLNDLGYNR